jgi:hypothetical protein
MNAKVLLDESDCGKSRQQGVQHLRLGFAW